jgi:hypothetical protein
MGRPTKFAPDVAGKIAQLVEVGNVASVAAQAVGVGPATFYRWMERGKRQRRGVFREFRESIQRARAQAKGRMVTIVSLAAEKDWRAAAHFLERRDPRHWGRRDNLTLDAQLRHGGKIQHEHEQVKPNLSVLTDAELAFYEWLILKLEAGTTGELQHIVDDPETRRLAAALGNRLHEARHGRAHMTDAAASNDFLVM